MSKRQAEKDELAAANFFLTVSLPPTVNIVNDADAPLDQFKKFTKSRRVCDEVNRRFC